MVVWFRHGSCTVGVEDGLIRCADFASLTALLDAANDDTNIKVFILDNSIVAMTGGQPTSATVSTPSSLACASMGARFAKKGKPRRSAAALALAWKPPPFAPVPRGAAESP